MRDLKFRYKWKGTWYYIDLRNDNTRAKFEAFESVNKTTPLEQFTGLKDKNGTEIYEGDLCNSGEDIGVIYSSPGYFSWGGCVMGCDDLCQSEMILEVVGNIHENPELLKSTK